MTNRPKAIGTAAESAVVKLARSMGFEDAERLVLHGASDQGDIRLSRDPHIILEVKGGHAAEEASDRQIAAWLEETERERINAGASEAFLVTKRKGHGKPDGWWVHWIDNSSAMTVRARLDQVLAWKKEVASWWSTVS